jgi:hypothetical protein
MNYDMVGSPNYIFMTQDADQSSFTAPVPVPSGSTAIEDLFESFYTLSDEPYDEASDQRADRDRDRACGRDQPVRGGTALGREVAGDERHDRWQDQRRADPFQ